MRGSSGDSFSGPGFGGVSNFSAAERQRSLTPSGETYQGRVLFYWETMLGLQPPTSAWQGLKIGGLGFPQDAPKSGAATASIFAYIKQIELDLAAMRVQNQAILDGQAAALLAQQSSFAVESASLIMLQGIYSNQQAASQQADQIIQLLISIDSKL